MSRLSSYFVLAQSCRCRGARDVQGRGSKSSPSSKSCLGRDGTFSSSCQLQCPLQGGTNNYNITAVIMAPNYVQNINWNHAEPIVNAVTNPRWSLTWSRRGSCSQSQPLLLPGQLKRCPACPSIKVTLSYHQIILWNTADTAFFFRLAMSEVKFLRAGDYHKSPWRLVFLWRRRRHLTPESV